MNRNRLISYAESFASFLLDSRTSEDIDRIILFGSVARGDFDEKSDIDIFIDTRKNMENDVEKRLRSFEKSEIKRRWGLKGIKNDISVKTGELDKWSLRRDVISSGIMLYGKCREMPENIKYYLLIKASFGGLERKDKISLWRKLYGYKQKVGAKKYVSRGLVYELGGKKFSSGMIAIPMERKNDMIKFLNKNKISYTLNEIWSDNI